MKSLKKPSKLFALLSVLALFLGNDAARAQELCDQGSDYYTNASVPAHPRAFYDMNLTNPSTMRDFLSVINSTHDLLIGKGVPAAKIKFVISLRGASVKFVTQTFGEGTTDQQVGIEIRQLLAALSAKNVRVEACEISLVWMNVAPATLVPQVTVIDNAFAESIWYQGKGYALVPISQLPS